MTAGFMVLSSSELGESWMLAEEMYLVRDGLRLATRAPTDLDWWTGSWMLAEEMYLVRDGLRLAT